MLLDQLASTRLTGGKSVACESCISTMPLQKESKMSLYQSVDDYREAHHKQPGGACAGARGAGPAERAGPPVGRGRFLDEGFAMSRPNSWPPQQKPISYWQACLWPIKSCMAAPLQTGQAGQMRADRNPIRPDRPPHRHCDKQTGCGRSD